MPGWPNIQISQSDEVHTLLKDELWAADLENEAARLWILTTPSSESIRALHEQKVRGRDIIVTENPRLHLIWSSSHIFVKPLPVYLLSYDIWHKCFSTQTASKDPSDSEIRKAALGFLRSYRFLIQHESDLLIAQSEEHRLVPPDIEWKDWIQFQTELKSIDESEISKRYQYGEIRLSRLNLYAPFLFGRLYYMHMPIQYGEYFGRLFAPVLITFAIASIILNTMQVALASESNSLINHPYLKDIFYWFSILALLAVTLVIAGSGILWLWMVSNEWIYTISHHRQRKHSQKAHRA